MSSFRQLVIRHVLALNVKSTPPVTGRRPFASSCSAGAARSQDIFEGWHTVIGLEIHAQLKAEEKLFSRASTSFVSSSRSDAVKVAPEPGTNIEPLDAGFPGTLPVLNPEAVDLALKVSLALKCEVNPRSTFDRKHYFYHDLPTGYQITQKYNPLARSGVLQISPSEDDALSREVSVGINQVQLEQDTAKSFSATGDGQFTVDVNRAGVGLVEIVTEPDMRSPEEAAAFARKLQSVLRRIGACDGDMDKGNFRIDANVSVHREGRPWGTRCEIKNLNSIRSMQMALDAEKRRHIAHYEEHGSRMPLKQETRGINELTGETFALRSKEEAEDYRYMPEPNVPAIVVTTKYLSQLQAELPELPSETAVRLQMTYGISPVDAFTLIRLDEQHGAGVKYFEDVAAGHTEFKKVANWVNHELLGQLSKREETWTPNRAPVTIMSELIKAVTSGQITGTAGKTLVKTILERSVDPSTALPTLSELLDELGLISLPSDALDNMCKAAIEKLPREAESVRKGKVNVLMRLVGEVMRQSKGRADAVKVKAILEKLLLK